MLVWQDRIAGATLVEQLVSLLLASIMITSLYGFYRTQLFHALKQESQTTTLEEARGALDIIVRDLRNAGAWVDGVPPTESGPGDDPESDPDSICNRVYSASATKIHIQMDLNGNGNCNDIDPRENVVYELTGPTTTCEGTRIIRRNGDCLVANVTTPISWRLFNYFDASGMDLGATPPVSAIKRIRLTFAVRARNPDPNSSGQISSELSTSIELRN
jgi:hypothetical protein